MSSCARCATDVDTRRFDGICPRCLLGTAMEEKPTASTTDAFPTPEELALLAKQAGLEFLDPLGRGGMAVVYKARQPALDRLVAVKILSRELAEKGDFSIRFDREAQALARLHHPNIVGIHEVGRAPGFRYIVMEYVQGRSLRRLLAERPFSRADVRSIVRQLCSALEVAHAAGIVHRDIKPENVLIDTAGRVKLVDFGISRIADSGDIKLTAPGLIVGTAEYMAPEQRVDSGGVDRRADIYSLGVLMAEMLTGRMPTGVFPKLAAFDAVVRKAMARDPEDRFPTAAALAAALEPSPALRVAVAVAILATLAGSIGIVASVFSRDIRPPDPPRVAFVALSTGELVFADVADTIQTANLQRVDLPDRFRLRFDLRYDIDGDQEPWIRLVCGPRALWLFPRGKPPCIRFARQEGGRWGLLEVHELPPDLLLPREWSHIELNATTGVEVIVNGRSVCREEITLAGPWTLEVLGRMKQVQIRDVGLMKIE